MILFYFSNSKQILNYYPGFKSVQTTNGKMYVGDVLMINDTTGISYKYVEDQVLGQDENGYVHDADYYETITPPPSDEERLAAVEQYLLEQELGL